METMKSKLTYIWDYYRYRIAFVIIGIVFVISITYRISHNTDKDIYIGFVNVIIGDELKTYMLENSPLAIQSYENLLLQDASGDNLQYTIASQTKILASIESHQLDIVILDEDSWAAFSQNGYLLDIKKYIETNCPALDESLSDYYEMNIDLSDEENPKEYYSGINLNFNDKIREAGFQGKVYFAIIKNTSRYESINKYISYIFGT